MTYRPEQNIADRNFGPISIIVPNINKTHQMVRKYEPLKNFNVKVDADPDANAEARDSAYALLDFM